MSGYEPFDNEVGEAEWNDSGPDFHSLTPPPRISQQVIQEVVGRLVSGGLSQGDRLPPESQLANSMGVSVASVREAFAILQHLGLVTVRHGSGRHVNRMTFPALVDPRIGPALMSGEMLLQVHEVRSAIELTIARQAAAYADETDVQRIGDALDAMATARRFNRLGAEEDAEFHHTIAIASKNVVFQMLDEALQPLFHQARELGLAKPRRYARVMEEHTNILEAIRAGDADAAERAVAAHLNVLERDATERLEDRTGDLPDDVTAPAASSEITPASSAVTRERA